MMTRRALFLVAALALEPLDGAQAADPAPPKLRLGDAARPLREAVDLTIDPTKERFSGAVDIDLELRVATTVLWLNASGLDVREAHLTLGGDRLSARAVPGGDSFVGFAFERAAKPGAARLRVAFEGALGRRDMEGLFAQQEGGEWYAFSQFEPLGARRAFPCFDEPSFKIPWRVTLQVRKDDVALSNTPAVSSADGPAGMKTVAFAETKPLPSYLVAVAAGPFDLVDAGQAGRKATPVRIVVPRGRAAEARWAAASTPKILALLEDYFDIPYPYEKLDEISVPLFFGAMENPGLVTYGQGIILQRPQEETIWGKRGFAGTAAHELAHQWFGDLVTTAWWDDLWLNESFASWMGEKISSRFAPEWGVEVDKVASRSGALRADSLTTARKIRQPIESNHDIANAFDGITYAKGEAVLEMFESWVGEEAFRKGVQRYLNAHAWGNATGSDFLKQVSAGTGRDLTTPFSTFLDQAGAPLVSVDLICGGGKPRLALTQKRYLPLGSHGGAPAAWQVPVCLRYGVGDGVSRECMLLTAASAEAPLSSASCPEWVVANDGGAGYYRVRYGEGLLARLLADGGRRLTAAERLGLLGDVSALVASGDLAASEALGIASGLAADPSRQVVSGTIGVVRGLSEFVPELRRPAYAAFVRKLYGDRARALGWSAAAGESEDVRLLRQEIVEMVAGRGEDASLGAQAVALAQRWLDDPGAIDPDMVEAVLAEAGRYGDRALFDRLHDEAKKSQDRERRKQLFGALGSFRDPALAPSVLAIALEDGFDPRESFGVIFGAAAEPATRALAYDFVKEHYDGLVARLPQGSVFSAAAVLPQVGARFCDEARRADLEAFFRPKAEHAAGGPRTLNQVLERIDLCIAQRRVQEPSLASFLEKTEADGSR